MGATDYFHDVDLALERIAKEGPNYGVMSPGGLLLEESNFIAARKFHTQEQEIVGKHTDDELFRGLVYCILAQMQDYGTQMYVFHKLCDNGCGTIDGVLENRAKVPEHVQPAVYNNSKVDYILRLAENWDSIGIHDILANPDEQAARKELIKQKGVEVKTASLFLRMCGMESLVPIDSWMIGMLYLHGYPIEIERAATTRDKKQKPIKLYTQNQLFEDLPSQPTRVNGQKMRKRSIKGPRYLNAEAHTQDLAAKYEQPPFLLQLAFWTKHSKFTRVPKRTLFDSLH